MIASKRRLIKHFSSVAIACACILGFSPKLSAQPSSNVKSLPDLQMPPIKGKPVKVSVGIYITNLASLDQNNETFELVGYLLASWKDPRLAFTPKDGEKYRSYNVNRIWTPKIELVNIKNFLNREQNEIRVNPDGTVNYNEKFHANLSSRFNIRRFPFDNQKLQAIVESFVYDTSQVTLESSQKLSGVSKEKYVSLAEWQINGWHPIEGRSRFEPENTEYSRLTFELDVSRNNGFYIWKVLVPMCLLTVISWTVFWLNPEDFGTQVSVSMTSMLSVIAFSFTVNNSLPKVTYLTFMDGFIIFCFILVLIAMIQVVAVHVLKMNGKPELGENILKHSRWAFPAVFAIVSIKLVWVFLIVA